MLTVQNLCNAHDIGHDVTAREVAKCPHHNQVHVHGVSSIQAVKRAALTPRSPNSIAGSELVNMVAYSAL